MDCPSEARRCCAVSVWPPGSTPPSSPPLIRRIEQQPLDIQHSHCFLGFPPPHTLPSLWTFLPNHTRYDVAIEPDLEAYTFTGHVKIEFSVDQTKLNDSNSKEIILHSKELAFVSASYQVTGTSSDNTTSTTAASVAVQASEIRVHLKDTTVTFVFPEAIPSNAEKIVLMVDYVGFLNNQMAGFYRSSYTDIAGQSQIMASTQFEALDARRALPCVDEPAAKAIFGVTLTIPTNRHCFSNMPESSVVTVNPKKKTVSFLDTPRMSPYLLAFCVGEFDCVQALTLHNVLVKVYSPPGKADSGKFALDCAVRCLDAYNDFFGVPYPLPKLDMVAIPEFAMVRTSQVARQLDPTVAWRGVACREDALSSLCSSLTRS